MMKFFCIFAAFALVTVAARPDNKNLLTDIIRALINNNRDKLANLNIELIDLGEFGQVTNLNLQNLENFALERLDSEGPFSIDISNATATLTTGSATGAFVFNNVQVPEINLNLNGEGDLSGSADLLWATLKLNCKLEGTSLSIVDFSEFSVSIGKLQATLTGIENADANNQIINNDLAQYLVNNLPRIAEENKVAILEKVNEILGQLS